MSNNNDKAAVDKLHAVYGRLKEEIGQVIVGHRLRHRRIIEEVVARG